MQEKYRFIHWKSRNTNLCLPNLTSKEKQHANATEMKILKRQVLLSRQTVGAKGPESVAHG